MCIVAVKRILAQPGLAVATILGLVVAIALTMSVPLYTDAVYYSIFVKNLSAPEQGAVPRPPFAFMFYYGGGLAESLQWEDIQPADQYLSGGVGADLGLPQEQLVRHFRTQYFSMFPANTTNFDDTSSALVLARLSFLSDLEAHVTLVEGAFPTPSAPEDTGPIEVLVSDALALKLGLQVGESYVVYAQDPMPEGGVARAEIPVRVAGVWTARDPSEAYWLTRPELLDSHLFVPEESFITRISPLLPDEIYAGIWYLIMDGSNVDYSAAATLLDRINVVEQRITSLLPGTRLEMSPRAELLEYRRAVEVLTILLYAFAAPLIGLLLAFVGLTVTLAVEQRRNEIAVLRSRGAMIAQVLGGAAMEGLLLGVVAVAIGAPVSVAIAGLIGQSRGFLEFTTQPHNLRIGLTVEAVVIGLGVVGLSLVTRMFPTAEAARHTIITYKQEQARMLQRPWWQRRWVDVLLLIPVAYGVYLLQQQGSIAGATLDPLANPLLFLAPALCTLALTLFCLRLMPLFMAVVSWIAARTRSVALLMAARHLSRSPGFYNVPLLLLTLTLSLSAFTASLAETLDRHLHDQAFYQVGADVQFFDFGEDATMPESTVQLWRFLPVTDYLEAPGVHGATRVGRYEATTSLSGGRQEGAFMGIDRFDFSLVAYWRDDFAQESLGALMNALALNPGGVLVPRDYMREHALAVGDTIRVSVRTYTQLTPVDLVVLGGFDLFPTWYPQEGPLFVGNLDYFFEQIGTQVPYYVWLRADPDVGEAQLNLRYSGWKTAATHIVREQERPERQGIFGMLSVGFVAAAVLTVLGFFLYALFSLRRRAIEIGVLRAVGLSSRQMVAFLGWELASLIAVGSLIGTVLGVSVSAFFIPFLQVGADPTATVPPFVVEIAWPAIVRVYILFGVLFAATLGGLALLLRRMPIFQAIKLGETV
ncbi:MAG: hypothetical protein Kow00120_15390 [Anaerolineae bacterium]